MSLVAVKKEQGVEQVEKANLKEELYINSLDVKTNLSDNIINNIKKIAVKVTREEANEAIMQVESIRRSYNAIISSDYDYNAKISKDNLVFWTDDKIQDDSYYYRAGISNESFFVKVKGQAKELLELLSERRYNHLIENRPDADYENELDAEFEQTNTRRFIRANPYDTLGKTTYDYKIRETEKIVYKTKDGEDVKIKKGLLYQCFDCNTYEHLEEIDAILHFRLEKGCNYSNETDKYDLLSSYSLRGVTLLTATCPKCKKEIDMKYVSYIGEASRKSGDISNSLFDDFKEKGKLTLSTISKHKSFFGDRCSVKTINNRVVLNLNTGRSYLLPSFNMNKKKVNSKRRLIQLGSNSISDAGHHVTLPLKLLYKAGNLIEKYLVENKLVNTKAIIPFDRYLENAITTEYRNLIPDEISAIMKSLQDDTLGSATSFERTIGVITRLEILMCYNQNPYVEYAFYRDAMSIKYYRHAETKFPTKVVNIKRIRNTDLIKQINEATNTTSKTEKDFIKTYSNVFNGYLRLVELKKVIKNKDNLNKVLRLEKEKHLTNSYNSTKNITNNAYLNRLIQEFGETNVINAILRKSEASPNHEPNYVYYNDTIYNYETIIEALPEYKLPSNRLRLKDLHDKIAKDAAKVKQAKKVYEYEEELMNTFDNKHIYGVDFKVATSNHELTEIGSIMHICVGGYSRWVEQGDNFIVSMQKNNEYIGCLEIGNDGTLCQAKARRNLKFGDNMQKILRKYCEMTNLETKTSDVMNEYKVTRDESKKSLFNNKPIKIKVTTDIDMAKDNLSPIVELPRLDLEDIGVVDDEAIPF